MHSHTLEWIYSQNGNFKFKSIFWTLIWYFFIKINVQILVSFYVVFLMFCYIRLWWPKPEYLDYGWMLTKCSDCIDSTTITIINIVAFMVIYFRSILERINGIYIYTFKIMGSTSFRADWWSQYLWITFKDSNKIDKITIKITK